MSVPLFGLLAVQAPLLLLRSLLVLELPGKATPAAAPPPPAGAAGGGGAPAPAAVPPPAAAAAAAGAAAPAPGTPTPPLDLADRDALRLYVLETLRLHPVVTATTLVAHEPVIVPQYGGAGKRARAFPKGCPITLALASANLDPAVWGSTPRAFAPREHSDKLWGPDSVFTGFASVGEHGERMCPARDMALEMAIDFLQAVYAQPL
jgi:hypothetical protein